MSSALSNWCRQYKKWYCSWNSERTLEQFTQSRFHVIKNKQNYLEIDMTIIEITLESSMLWISNNSTPAFDCREFMCENGSGNNSLFDIRNTILIHQITNVTTYTFNHLILWPPCERKTLLHLIQLSIGRFSIKSTTS